jgi:hypothetical protein
MWDTSTILIGSVPLSRILNAITLIAVFIINALAGATKWIGGKNTGEISDLLPNYLVPAGSAFSIWGAFLLLLAHCAMTLTHPLLGLIYLFFCFFLIFQTLPRFYPSEVINSSGNILWINFLGNILWILLWGFGLRAISVVVIIAMFGSAFCVYYRYVSVLYVFWNVGC